MMEKFTEKGDEFFKTPEGFYMFNFQRYQHDCFLGKPVILNFDHLKQVFGVDYMQGTKYEDVIEEAFDHATGAITSWIEYAQNLLDTHPNFEFEGKFESKEGKEIAEHIYTRTY